MASPDTGTVILLAGLAAVGLFFASSASAAEAGTGGAGGGGGGGAGGGVATLPREGALLDPRQLRGLGDWSQAGIPGDAVARGVLVDSSQLRPGDFLVSGDVVVSVDPLVLETESGSQYSPVYRETWERMTTPEQWEADLEARNQEIKDAIAAQVASWKNSQGRITNEEGLVVGTACAQGVLSAQHDWYMDCVGTAQAALAH